MSELLETKKRRGKANKPKKGDAASFAPGGAEPPKEFDAAEIAEEMRLWWENEGGERYLIQMDEGGPWSVWPEGKIVKLLRTKWVRLKPREGENLSEADRVLLHVMQKRRLELSMPALAGYPQGIHDIGGSKVLVRKSPRLVKPEKGDWETVCSLIDGKLNLSSEGGADQVPYFHGWMKSALEALFAGPGNWRPGQCLIFAGRGGSGKSRLQQMISWLLGGDGRTADPGPYLFGRTDFNGEMFGAEHLCMGDPASGTKTVDRVFFGEQLKQLLVNDEQRLHAKREDAIMVSPFWRVTISINDDPDKMRVLPLLTPDLKDKVSLFHVSTAPLPMPTKSLEERAEFRRVIASELPAYAHWLLNEFTIPEAIQSDRYGVREWHHPSLVMELFDDTPAAELLTIIDAASFKAPLAGELATHYKLWDLKSLATQEEMGEVWEGSAIDLEKLLMGGGEWTSSVGREAKKIAAHNKVDRLLSRLKEDQPERVRHCRDNAHRWWKIVRPE